MSAKLQIINKDMKNKQLEGFNVRLESSNSIEEGVCKIEVNFFF